MDDFISGINSVDEGNLEIKKISPLLQSTGFTMNECNACKEILEAVCKKNLAPSNRCI